MTKPYADRRRTHPLWIVWSRMVRRCTNPKDEAWKNYGGRGIKVCDRWLGFDGFPNFVKDMGLRPEGTSLDRRDNDKGYSPENCRWATPTEQMRNTRINRMIEFRGQLKCLQEWADEIGMQAGTLSKRLDAGMSIEEAFSTPVRLRKDITVEQVDLIRALHKSGFRVSYIVMKTGIRSSSVSRILSGKSWRSR